MHTPDTMLNASSNSLNVKKNPESIPPFSFPKSRIIAIHNG
jgi:hypothetical protein